MMRHMRARALVVAGVLAAAVPITVGTGPAFAGRLSCTGDAVDLVTPMSSEKHAMVTVKTGDGSGSVIDCSRTVGWHLLIDARSRESLDLGLTITGGHGHDQIIGSFNGDTIHGGAGHDGIHGVGGIDMLFGEGGDDVMSGGDQVDTFFGGTGNDVIFLTFPSEINETETADGGPGRRDVACGPDSNDTLVNIEVANDENRCEL